MPQRAPGAGTSGVGIGRPVGYYQAVRRLEGARTPIIDYVKQNLPWYVGSVIRQRDPFFNVPRISMGSGGVPIQQQGGSIPVIRTKNSAGTTITGNTSSQEIDRRDTTSVQGKLPMKTFNTTKPLPQDQVDKLWDLGHIVVVSSTGQQQLPSHQKQSSQQTVIQTKPAATVTKPTGSTSMDLGSIITDLGTAYIKSKYSPQPVSYSQPALLPSFDIEGDIPFIDIVSNKKRCRRRRRRLATTSDIKDLAALKAVLGGGDAFKTWIATHRN